MTQLYRIKPLEWVEDSCGDCFVHSRFHVCLTENGEWGYSGRNLATGREASKEAAKAACESHRRNLLEAELEPAYQPTTELPTEPGLYWFRENTKSEWDFRFVNRTVDNRLIVITDVNWHEPRKGQWIRIPEPEGQP